MGYEQKKNLIVIVNELLIKKGVTEISRWNDKTSLKCRLEKKKHEGWELNFKVAARDFFAGEKVPIGWGKMTSFLGRNPKSPYLRSEVHSFLRRKVPNLMRKKFEKEKSPI